jgi:putative addiction module antidote
MVELKISKFGDSLGVVLPKEVVTRLQAAEGQPLFLVETAGDGYLLTTNDPNFELKMSKAEDIFSRYHNTLEVLAK